MCLHSPCIGSFLCLPAEQRLLAFPMGYDCASFGTGEMETAAVPGDAEFWEDAHIVVESHFSLFVCVEPSCHSIVVGLLVETD